MTSIEEQMLAVITAKAYVRVLCEQIGEDPTAVIDALKDAYDSLASIRFMQLAKEIESKKELEGSGVKLDN